MPLMTGASEIFEFADVDGLNVTAAVVVNDATRVSKGDMHDNEGDNVGK
jgi:hypothetical protein